MLNMRFEGTDTALMILCEGDELDADDFEAAFKREYKKEFGFLLEAKMVVDDVKVRVMACMRACGLGVLNVSGSWDWQDV